MNVIMLRKMKDGDDDEYTFSIRRMHLLLSLSLSNGRPEKALGGRRRVMLMEDMT